MRFQHRFDTTAWTTALVTPQPAAPRAVPARRPASKHLNKLLVRGAIGGAVLLVAAGCATLDADVAKAWKIEPVFNVKHALQSSQAYYTMGRYHDGSKAWDKAADAYRKAIAVDAQNIEAYNALGVALAQSGRYADAETTLRQAVAIAPALTHVRSNLGYVLLLAGKPREAVLELKAAVKQDSGNATAIANLRDALAQSDAAQSSTVATIKGTEAKMPEAAAFANASEALVVSQRMPIELHGDTISVNMPVTVGVNVPASVSVPMPITVAEVPAPPTASVSVPMPLLVASLPAPQTIAAAPVAALRSLNVEQRALRLEVSNGNGVAGMAARVGRWLATQGVDTERLTNQRPFVQQTTVIQYSSGHEGAAQLVARSLPAYAKAATAPTQGLRSDVRVVLGRDWVQTAACLERSTCQPAATSVAAAPSR